MKYKFVLFVFMILSGADVYSQSSFGWQWIHPRPQGNTLNWVKVFDSNTWYAGGSFGTFMKTTNGGLNWHVSNKAGWPQVAAFNYAGDRKESRTAWFFNQNTGIVAGSGSGILRTVNAGNAFDTIQILSELTGVVNGLYFINSQTGFLCGNTNYGIMKTVNGGLNWVSLNAPLGSYYCIAVPDSNNIIAGDELGKVQISPDGGYSWTEIITGQTRAILDLKFSNANTGYFCTGYGGFRFTTNGGNNWIAANTPYNTYKNTLMKLLIDGNTVYAAGNDTVIYKTTDKGTTWDSLRHYENGQYYSYTQNDLAKSGNTMVLVGIYGNINSSSNNGISWRNLNYRKSLATFSTLFVESSAGNMWVAGGAGNNDAVVYSSNGGSNWITMNANTNSDIYKIQMVNSNTGYICGYPGFIKKTTDKGYNWSSLQSPLTPDYGYSGVDFVNENTGWIVGGWTTQLNTASCIIKTTNGGANFTVQVPPNNKPYSCVDMVDLSTGWACGSNSVVRTSNGGTNWISIDPPNLNPLIYLLKIKAVDGNTAVVCGSHAKIFKTTNGGVNWDSVRSPWYNLTWFSTDWINANTGVVVGSNGATARTTDSGLSWFITNNGGGESLQDVVMTARDTMFAVSYRSEIFKSYEDVMTNSVKYENNIPAKYYLEQNYPNPFNPVTTIRFSIPEPSVVSLKVYDITGKLVKELINGGNYNTGTFSCTFSAEGLSSGIYIYSLFADNKIVSSKKMVIVK